MQYVLLLGRIFYSLMFLWAFFGHFSQKTIQFAATHGVPMASFIMPLMGIIAAVGGLSILLGYKAKWGAWLIVIFLAIMTCMLHKFWRLEDPMMAMVHRAMFLKNLALIGAALIIAFFGSGPLSLEKGVMKKGRK